MSHKTVFYKGPLNVANLTHPKQLVQWMREAQHSGENDFELLVFKVPYAGSVLSVEKIENLLLELFPMVNIEQEIAEYRTRMNAQM